jgi:hypothetical protein
VTDLDDALIRTAQASMPITFSAAAAYKCDDRHKDIHARLKAARDGLARQLQAVEEARAEREDEEEEQEDLPLMLTLRDELEVMDTLLQLPPELAGFFATTGEGKTYLQDTLLYTTCPTKEEYHKAGRHKEKDKVKDDLFLVRVKVMKGLARGKPLDRGQLAPEAAKLRATIEEYFQLYANPVLQQHLPTYLSPEVLAAARELEERLAAAQGERPSPASDDELRRQIQELIVALHAAVNMRPPPQSGVRIVRLEADPVAAQQSWSRLRAKFGRLHESDRLGSQETFLLRSSNTHGTTTHVNRMVGYCDKFMAVETLKKRGEILTALFQTAEMFHPQSPLYHTPDAIRFRSSPVAALRLAQYKKLTKLRIPQPGESAGPPAGVDISPEMLALMPQAVRERHLGVDSRMPTSPNDVTLQDEVKRLLAGPRVTIYLGNNEDLIMERYAVKSLLAEEGGAAADVRRYMMDPPSVYGPSSILKKLGFIDVPGQVGCTQLRSDRGQAPSDGSSTACAGYGTTDPGERNEISKALERVTLSVVLASKNLGANDQAHPLIQGSRFMQEAWQTVLEKKREREAARTQEQGGGAGGGQAAPRLPLINQRVAILAYPEHNGQALTGVRVSGYDEAASQARSVSDPGLHPVRGRTCWVARPGGNISRRGTSTGTSRTQGTQ